ncbi:CNH domain-containing protein [Paraphysoderma sedebokerense]|nr:CNH domain-containing protein [Paraphysoderma sedebokerense]
MDSLSLRSKGRTKRSASSASHSEPLVTPHQSQQQPRNTRVGTIPLIYPALLSKVAIIFKQRIPLTNQIKDSLEYKNCFVGRDAVDLLSLIIRTGDRNLALLVGRALDAQKFFYDVTYTHRLRDSSNELYKFQDHDSSPNLLSPDDEEDLPTGVFTILTDCYSSTCSRERICYSIACPRRLEQQSRHISATSSMKRSQSEASLPEAQAQEEKFWSTYVPEEIRLNATEEVVKRQEVIFELIHSEEQFVNDLDSVEKIFIQPLLESDLLPPQSRSKFISDVFGNILTIRSLNEQLSLSLQRRQQESWVVDRVGDVFYRHVVNLEGPYVEYGATQPWGKHWLETEVAKNPDLGKFLAECEKRPESRKLPIQSFLARPTTRMGRYPLLLDSILRKTPEDHPDRADLEKSIAFIKTILKQINIVAGRSDNAVRLTALNESLIFRSGETQDLKLLSPERQLIRDGPLKKKAGSGQQMEELTVFLLDHCLLLTKKKKVKNLFEYKVNRNPIPHEFLILQVPDENPTPFSTHRRSAASLSPSPSSYSAKKTEHPINITHLGRNGGQVVLYASSIADRRQWVDKITQAKELMELKNRRWDYKVVWEWDTGREGAKINGIMLFENRVIVGSDNGLYVATEKDNRSSSFTKILDQPIQQVDISSNSNAVLVLSEKTLYAFPIDILDAADPSNPRKARKVSSHVSFFKCGTSNEKPLIVVVKTSTLSTTIKAYEPVVQTKKQSGLAKLIKAGAGGTANDLVKLYKELYIPSESTSVSFLKTKLCVGCVKGFEIVDLGSLATQELLDPADESLSFVLRRDNVKPIAIFRISDTFLLCYNEFGFYVNKNGRRVRNDWLVNWECDPIDFACYPPYILAFSSSFVEIRDLTTGKVQQIIPVTNLSCIRATDTAVYAVIESTAAEHRETKEMKDPNASFNSGTGSSTASTVSGGYKIIKLFELPKISALNESSTGNGMIPRVTVDAAESPFPSQSRPSSAASIGTVTGSAVAPLLGAPHRVGSGRLSNASILSRNSVLSEGSPIERNPS